MKKYYYRDKEGKEKGPVETGRLIERMDTIKLTGRTPVRRQDSREWIRLSKIPKEDFENKDFDKFKDKIRSQITEKLIYLIVFNIIFWIGLLWALDLL